MANHRNGRLKMQRSLTRLLIRS